MNPEINYHFLKFVEQNPNLTQRQAAGVMGFSLGKFNYSLKELIKKGFVKIDRFTTSDNKAGYMYLLTPSGIEEKSRVTSNFLRCKIKEFEEIKKQIDELQQEVADGSNLSLPTEG